MKPEEMMEKLVGEYKQLLEGLREKGAALGDLPTAMSQFRKDLETINSEIKALKVAPVKVTMPGAALDGRPITEVYKRFGTWFKAAVIHDEAAQAEWKTMSEGTAAAGGDFVPVEFVPEIQRIMGQAAVLRPIVRHFPVGKKLKDIPVGTTGVTLVWTDEGVAATPTTPANTKATLTIKKLNGYTPVTNELLEDTDVGLGQYLMEVFGEAFAAEEDKQGFVGTGAPFKGILAETGVAEAYLGGSSDSGKTAFSDVTADDLSFIIDEIPSMAQKNAKFFMNRTIMHYVRTLKDSNKNPIYIAPSAPTVPGTIYGYPVLTSDQLPARAASAVNKAFVAFGDPKLIWFGDRAQMSMKQSSEVLFLEDKTVFLFAERIGIVLGLPAGFVRLKTAAS